jgi:AAA family ATP:ADP antiporter
MLGRVLVRVVDVREREASAVVLGCAYFFFVLASWYVLRPVRDEMGAAGGVQNLAWLFTGTLLLTLVANPLFSLLVARLRVRRFVPLVYHFFGVNLFLFLLLFAFASPNQNVWLGRVFFVWTSVFNLFVVSVFWACMADAFRPEQAKRLFGFVGVGGTLGGITGAAATAALAGRIGTPGLLLLSTVLLECE